MELTGFLRLAIGILRYHKGEWKRTQHGLRRKPKKLYPLYHRAAYCSLLGFVTDVLRVERRRIMEIVDNPKISTGCG